MHGAALSYNVQLARLRGRDRLVAEHQASFDEWTASFPLEEVRAWSVSRLWELTIDHGHTVTPQTRSFELGGIFRKWDKKYFKSKEIEIIFNC
jgi:hypothetical protein